MRALGVSIIGALAALALSCGTAFGQGATDLEPGVHADPGSPAAKEYALPLTQARRTGAAPSSHENPPEASLFGAGIKPPGSGGSGGSPRSGPGPRASTPGRVSGTSRASGTPRGEPATLPPAVLRAARSPGAGGGDGSLLALLGGGVVILVLGGFGGTVLRHNRRPTSSLPAPPRPTPSG
jgi:hypothetical protein